MATAFNIPNEFTGCEEYRGHVIAICQGRYSIWNNAGNCRGGHYATRADARSALDRLYVETFGEQVSA